MCDGEADATKEKARAISAIDKTTVHQETERDLKSVIFLDW